MTAQEQYDAAMDSMREASRLYRAATEQYRARLIGDAEFLSYRAALNAANDAVDVAEQNLIN
jgi:outer membrane protein TolC